MRRTLLACLAVMATASALKAGALAPPPPLTARLPRADAVVIGKVVTFEDKAVKADGAAYRVAVVKVEETLLGTKGLTHVKVGIRPPIEFRGSGGVQRFMPAANLTAGQTVLLLLTSHPKEPFFVMPNANDALDSRAGNYKTEVELSRRAATLLADPATGLKAKEPGERLLAATLVLARYQRSRPGYGMKDLPAGESKAILQALADADWKFDPALGSPPALTTFYSLGLTERDGWKQPEDFRQVPETARQWLRDNAEKYRIKGFQPVK